MASETISLQCPVDTWTLAMDGANHESARVTVMGSLEFAAYFGTSAPVSAPGTAYSVVSDGSPLEISGALVNEKLWLCPLGAAGTVTVMRAV